MSEGGELGTLMIGSTQPLSEAGTRVCSTESMEDEGYVVHVVLLDCQVARLRGQFVATALYILCVDNQLELCRAEIDLL